MSIKLAGCAITLSGCLALAGCGAGDASSDREATGVNATGGVSAAGGANAAGRVNAAGGAPGAGAPAMGGGAGVGGETLGGGKAGAGLAGRAGEGGSGSGAVAGAAGDVGGAGGRADAGGHAEGGGGEMGFAGHGGAGHAGTSDQAGAGGSAGLGPAAPGGRISGYGTVLFQANSRNEIVRLQTTMVVPPEPPPSGTLFLWPGLQPNGANFEPIDNGVLQPVLTWGPSCAPGKQPRAYSTWWISGQYVNTFGSEPGYTDCQGGTVMAVDAGDSLTIDMALAGTIWTQTVTDQQSGQAVTYRIDMLGQAQNLAYFVIEEYSSAPVSEVIFTDIVITFGSADAADCKLTARGQTDYVSVPVPSSDGLTCSIAEIILRAEGID